MLSRMTGGKVEDVARPFAYASFLDMARASAGADRPQHRRNAAPRDRHAVHARALDV